MAEVNFARSFLSMLDSRPIKLSGEHVEDPKTYPARSAYTLPKMPRPMSKPRAARRAAPGQERGVAVAVRSLRNPPLDVRLPAQGPSTSLLDVKAAVAAATGIPAARLKLLFRRKPVADSKVLKDLLPAEGGEGGEEAAIEFSVMVMGGAAAVGGVGGAAGPAKESSGATLVVAQGGASGAEVLDGPAFWGDLRGFLMQRVRDEKLAEELSDTFQTAWKAKR